MRLRVCRPLVPFLRFSRLSVADPSSRGVRSFFRSMELASRYCLLLDAAAAHSLQFFFISCHSAQILWLDSILVFVAKQESVCLCVAGVFVVVVITGLALVACGRARVR